MKENKGGAYSALAPFYEKFSVDCDYEKWSQSICKKVFNYSPEKTGIDLACGSGYFTRALKKSGFDIIGVDKSEEMLNEAKKRSVSENLRIEYLSGDIKTFRSLKKVGFITVINDGFNYLKQDELKKAFSRARDNLVKGGALIFDISSEYKLKEVIANNLFAEDYDEVTYLWFNTLSDESVNMDLTFFSYNGKNYDRFDESQTQYIHKLETIKDALLNSGFEIAEIYDENELSPTDKSMKINFVAIKK